MSNALERLDPATCLTLIQRVPVGRIAWAEDDGTVTVLPVNFALDGEDLVFATAAGAKLDAVRAGRPLTFEADDLEPALRTAWSVLLTGPPRSSPTSARRSAFEHCRSALGSASRTRSSSG